MRPIRIGLANEGVDPLNHAKGETRVRMDAEGILEDVGFRVLEAPTQNTQVLSGALCAAAMPMPPTSAVTGVCIAMPSRRTGVP